MALSLSAAGPRLVGPSGLEPPTSCLSGTRSNHLSYEPSFRGAPDGILSGSFSLVASFLTTIFAQLKIFEISLFGSRPASGGGDDGIRTHDPLLAGQVLSQLSYTPIFVQQLSSSHFWDFAFLRF